MKQKKVVIIGGVAGGASAAARLRRLDENAHIVVVERGTAHKFSSPSGAVLEEISTTHYKDDSFYDDPAIKGTASRKTYLTFYADWLNGEVR